MKIADIDVNIVGNDPQFQKMLSQALMAAKTNATILIRGENGTGKEVLAKLIRQSSPRADKPFIAVNCAAIPANLIESELFGYEEGSFTDAKRSGKEGKFQLADGGTIFLDEIGDMPLMMQAKLLRVLEESQIEKIGTSTNVPVDVRVVAATNQPLERLIREKQFREDLYYRLNVISLTIPPLRERPNDILLLTDHFLSVFNGKYGKQLTISRQCEDALLKHSWIGNVRELRSCIERAVILCTEKQIGLADMPFLDQTANIGAAANTMTAASADSTASFYSGHDSPPLQPYQQSMDQFERSLLLRALEVTGGNKTEALKQLGLTRTTFYRRLNHHGIQ